MTLTGAPTLLVPVDTSDHSEVALFTAVELGQRIGGRLQLVLVLDARVADIVGNGQTGDRTTLGNIAERYLSSLARRLASAEVPVDTSHRLGTDAPAEIIEAAFEIGADLIVMASHGRSGGRRTVMGSTAEQVLRSSTIPVVVVPTHTRQSETSNPAPADERRVPSPVGVTASSA